MKKSLLISDLRGGRNGADPPISLPDNQAVEMLNVDHYGSLLGNKRGGSTAVTETGGTAFSSGVLALHYHVPGASLAAGELWGIDGAATPIVKRMTGGTSFADITMSDVIATAAAFTTFASFNGKLYMAYDSSVDRLHVYDPNLSSPRVRRVGFADPGALASVVDDGGTGTYAAILRYYRARWVQISSSVTIRRSEPGPSTSFTPNGNDTGVVITQPTVPSEQETHWEIEVSLDNVTFYRLSQTAIATTTYTDSAATTTYINNTQSADVGEYENWTSVKHLLTDGNRLLGAGGWETGAKNSRVWFSPVLGTTDEGDDERVITTRTQKNYVDLNENDGGFITALGGPIYGAPFAFKYRQIWKLTPTGDVNRPYISRKISDAYGCIAHKSVVSAIDASGNPAIYFLSAEGPCRIVTYGQASIVQYLGRDVEDLWASVNLSSTIVGHAVYYAEKHQVWFWFAVDSNNNPSVKLVFDVLLGRFIEGDRVRGGWYKHDGGSAVAWCSIMAPDTLGASMSFDRKPYIGRASGTAIWELDTSATDDAGTDFQAYVKTKPLDLGSLGQNFSVGQTVLTAKAATGVTITQTLDRNYGLETRTSTAVLTASGTETRVIKKFEASDLAQAAAVQISLGETTATDQALWSLDALEVPIMTQEIL